MVGSVGTSGGGSSASGSFGSIGSSGLSSFDLGGIAPNGGGPAPTGTGALGAAGLSPIGSSGLTAFGLSDRPSEAAQLQRYNDLVQQGREQLDAARQSTENLSRSMTELSERNRLASPPPPIEPPRFPPPPSYPTFFMPPPAANFGPPAPPAFTSQPLDAGSFAPPPPTTSAFALTEAAGGPAPAAPSFADLPAPILDTAIKPAAPSTPFAMTPNALASPVTRPDIAAPAADLDPFAPVGQGGLGLSPVGPPVFDVPGGDVAKKAEPGSFGRMFDRIGDNFTGAFAAPLGPGAEYRNAVSPFTTPTGYMAIDAFTQPLNNTLLIGVPTLFDLAGRTIGATYNSVVDTGTEALVGLGMDPTSANSLGRDLKAMPEAFGGSPGMLMGPRVAPRQTVTVYRVEGAGNQRIVVGESGSVDIPPVFTRSGSERNLFLNFGNSERAEQFKRQRLEQFPDSTVRSFKVPQSFLDEIRATAVPESKRALNPDRPVIADPTRAADQFGLSGPQIEQLRSVIIPGTGLTPKSP